MYLHRLEFQGVGPFAGRHVLDLDALGGSGLFLLEGPTGSGKSTVIDALTFALYGETAGGLQASRSRLRSAHVGTDVESYVDLVLSTSAGAFRIRRTPAYERPKRRGSGTTPQNATAKLWRLSPDELEASSTGANPGGELLASQVSDAATQIAGIVGLSHEQFTQTVVLPQGDFATFLRSSSDEREAILQRVFGTDVFRDVQATLVREARERRTEVEAASTRLTARAEAYLDALPEDLRGTPEAAAEAAAEEATDTPPTGPAPGRAVADAALALQESVSGPAEAETVASRVTEVDGALDARATALAQERAGTRARLARAQEAAAAQERTADALARRARLLARRERHEAEAEQVRERSEALAAADLAARVAPADRAAGLADAAVDDAHAVLEVARSGLPEDAPTSVTDLDDLRESARAATAEVARLDRARGELARALSLEQALPARQAEVDDRSTDLTARREALEQRRAALRERPQQRAEIDGRRAAAREDASRRTDAATAAQEAHERHEAAVAAQDAAREVTEAQGALRSAGEVALTAETTAHALRRRRIEGIAGELAGSLVDGQPCAVCGSTAHPDPASPAPDHPSAEEVETASAAAADAAQEQAIARSRLDVATSRHDHLVARAGGLDGEAAATARQEAEEALARATAAHEEAERLEARLSRFDAETATLGAELSADTTSLAQDESRLEVDRESLAADREECARARADHPTVAARDAQLADMRRRTDAVATACTAAADAEHRRSEAHAQLDRALEDAGFVDLAAARSAVLLDEERDRLRRAVQAHREEAARIAEGLAAADVAALDGSEVADVDGARAEVERARESDERALTELTVAQSVADGARRLGEALVQEARAHVTLRAQGAALVRLADLAAGSTGSLSRVTLSTWVLLRRFEDMIAAANDRLRTMSSGRYELVRADRDGGRRAGHAGLGLLVVDHRTGTRRPPATLSGGETFYVSLALALGLADVVRAEAGGVEIGTLLIDEGFGSLDQETLDVVMNELTALRDAGRTVGLVSHVTEMKRMIPDQVRVRRASGGGSTLEVTWMR